MTDEDAHWKMREEFFSLVGQAITRWSYIDRDLFDFCRFALNASEKMSAIIFYRSPTIGDHMNLTDSLMKAAQLHERHLRQWAAILAEMNRLLPLRNEIAHNPHVSAGMIVIQLNSKSSEPGQVVSNEQWYEIRTEQRKLLRQSKNKAAQPFKVKSADLLKHLQELQVLEDAIHAVQWDLFGRPRGLSPTIPAPEFPRSLDRE
jgi:hypothetical protein